MGFLQDAEAIAHQAGSDSVSVKELEVLRLKHDMDSDAFKLLKKKSKRGSVAVRDIQNYMVEFTQPLFESKHALNQHHRGSKRNFHYSM